MNQYETRVPFVQPQRPLMALAGIRNSTVSRSIFGATQHVFSIAFIALAIVQIGGAWLWSGDASLVADVDKPFGDVLKLATYLAFSVQGGRGALLVLSGKIKIPIVFVLQSVVLFSSILINGNYFYSLQAGVTFIGITFGVLATCNTLGGDRVIRIAATTLFVLVAISILVAVLAPQYGRHLSVFQGQWRGLFNHKNQLGSIAFYSVLLCGIFWSDGYFKLFWTCILTSFLCLVMSGSALSLACAVLALCIYIGISLARLMRLPLIILVSIIVIFSFVVFLYSDQLVELIIRIFNKTPTFSGRTIIWRYMWALGENNPVLGHGPGFILSDLSFMDALRRLTFDQLRSPHNSYIMTFVDFGYTGIVLQLFPYLILVVYWFRTFGNGPPFRSALLLAVPLSILCFNFFEAQNVINAGVGTMIINIVLVSAYFGGRPEAQSRRKHRQ